MLSTKMDRSRNLLLLAAGWMAVAVPTVVRAQATAPVFDSVSIKPHPSGGVVSIIPSGPFAERPPAHFPEKMSDGIRDEDTTLLALVQQAYGLLWPWVDDVMFGEPDWARTERFDIDAKMSETDIAEMQTLISTEREARRSRMLQALLADRFKLKVHWEKRELPIYALVVAKSGAKLTPSSVKGKFMRAGDEHITLQGQGDNTITLFADELARRVGRVVFDRTGIKGGYDMTLKLPSYDTQLLRTGARIPPPSDDPNAPPSLYTAIQDQLGLKLEPTKAPLDVLVIDHVERPSPN
jgi:uncharacterized protein (TIGR03435 family)